MTAALIWTGVGFLQLNSEAETRSDTPSPASHTTSMPLPWPRPSPSSSRSHEQADRHRIRVAGGRHPGTRARWRGSRRRLYAGRLDGPAHARAPAHQYRVVSYGGGVSARPCDVRDLGGILADRD